MFRIFVPLKLNSECSNVRYNLTERQSQIIEFISEDSSVQIEDIMDTFELSRRTTLREIQEIKKHISLSYDKKTQRWNVKK